MSGTYEINAALSAHLASLVASDKVAWEGLTFDPPLEAIWYRETFFAAQPSAAAIGVNAKNRHTGFYQIDVYAPINFGRYDGVQEAERLVSSFKRGTVLINAGVIVNIHTAYVARKSPMFDINDIRATRATLQSGNAWLQVVVRVYWWADVTNE